MQIPHQKLKSSIITSPTANVPPALPPTDSAAELLVGKTVWMTTVVVLLLVFACEVILEAVVDVLLGGAVTVTVAVALVVAVNTLITPPVVWVMTLSLRVIVPVNVPANARREDQTNRNEVEFH